MNFFKFNISTYFFLLLPLQFALANSYEWKENVHFSPVSPIRTQIYQTTNLSDQEMDRILNQNIFVLEIADYQRFGNAVAYVLSLSEPKLGEPWKNLAEKRYSHFRDLLARITSISERPTSKWKSFDFKLDDGSYFFYGNVVGPAFAIRASDGALFKGNVRTLPKNAHIAFEEIIWNNPPKQWELSPNLHPTCVRDLRSLKSQPRPQNRSGNF